MKFLDEMNKYLIPDLSKIVSDFARPTHEEITLEAEKKHPNEKKEKIVKYIVNVLVPSRFTTQSMGNSMIQTVSYDTNVMIQEIRYQKEWNYIFKDRERTKHRGSLYNYWGIIWKTKRNAKKYKLKV